MILSWFTVKPSQDVKLYQDFTVQVLLWFISYLLRMPILAGFYCARSFMIHLSTFQRCKSLSGCYCASSVLINFSTFSGCQTLWGFYCASSFMTPFLTFSEFSLSHFLTILRIQSLLDLFSIHCVSDFLWIFCLAFSGFTVCLNFWDGMSNVFRIYCLPSFSEFLWGVSVLLSQDSVSTTFSRFTFCPTF